MAVGEIRFVKLALCLNVRLQFTSSRVLLGRQSSLTFCVRFFPLVFAILALATTFLPVAFFPNVEVDVGSLSPPMRASSIVWPNSCVIQAFTPVDQGRARPQTLLILQLSTKNDSAAATGRFGSRV